MLSASKRRLEMLQSAVAVHASLEEPRTCSTCRVGRVGQERAQANQTSALCCSVSGIFPVHVTGRFKSKNNDPKSSTKCPCKQKYDQENEELQVPSCPMLVLNFDSETHWLIYVSHKEPADRTLTGIQGSQRPLQVPHGLPLT